MLASTLTGSYPGMESVAPGLTSWIFFPFIEKLYPPVSSTVPASLQARGRRLRDCKRAKVEQKEGGGIYVTSVNWTYLVLFIKFQYMLP